MNSDSKARALIKWHVTMPSASGRDTLIGLVSSVKVSLMRGYSLFVAPGRDHCAMISRPKELHLSRTSYELSFRDEKASTCSLSAY